MSMRVGICTHISINTKIKNNMIPPFLPKFTGALVILPHFNAYKIQ